MMDYGIELVWDRESDADGLYSMTGAGCTSVEGFAPEWLEIANAIPMGRSVSFKRCAMAVHDRRFFFSSPRNAHGISDRESMGMEEAFGLAKAIKETLAWNGEPCMFSDFGYDPIAMGC